MEEVDVAEIDVQSANGPDGKLIRIIGTDVTGRKRVSMVFGIEHFVAVADHLQMLASELVASSTRLKR